MPFYAGQDPAAPLPVLDRASYQRDLARFQASPPPPDTETMTSSGTSGPPLVITADQASWHAVNQLLFRQIAQLAGLPASVFRPGELAVLFVSNKPGRQSFVRALPELDSGLYLRLQLGGNPAGEAALVARSRTVILYGKPSYLLELRQLLRTAGYSRSPLQPRLLLTSGERLYPDDRHRLRDYFHAPMVDALASTEGGLIAATRPDESSYLVFGDNVYLEVLDGDGSPARSGAGELLLTNLRNRATVFVRYRTGDHAVLHTDADGQSLSRLTGRDPERLMIAGAALPADLVSTRLGSLPGVGDFQLDLTAPDRPTLRWSADAREVDPAAVTAALADAVAALAPGLRLPIEQVRRITPPGGKKRRFVGAVGSAGQA